MNRSLTTFTIGILFTLTLFLADICAQEHATGPVTHNGKKWRIGYFEGGPYANYQAIFKAMIQDLMDSGWIQPAPIPKCTNKIESRTLWKFLSGKIQSRFLEFPSDAYYTAEWEDESRIKLKHDIIKRLKNKNDIDLMLGFGTWAGQDLANNQHNTPTMILSASNAVSSGIIKSAEDSGYDHVHAWIDPEKSVRQLRLFHEITGFEKLGLAYENRPSGRSYAAVDDVIKLSRQLGFKVIECHLPAESGISNEAFELTKCYQTLAPQIDSIFITDYSGLSKKSVPDLLVPLFKHKILMFAQTRYDLVKNGILMGTGRSDFKADAGFYTKTFSKILNGTKPRDLPQKFESPLDLVINLESAKKIEFRIPLDILTGASEIYETIESPDNEK